MITQEALRRAVAEFFTEPGCSPVGPLRPPELPPIDLLLARPTGTVLLSLARGEGASALRNGLAQRAWISAWRGTFPGLGSGPVHLDVVAGSYDTTTRWMAAGLAATPGSASADLGGADLRLLRYRHTEAGLRLEPVAVPSAGPGDARLAPADLDAAELEAFAAYRPRFLHPDRHADA